MSAGLDTELPHKADQRLLLRTGPGVELRGDPRSGSPVARSSSAASAFEGGSQRRDDRAAGDTIADAIRFKRASAVTMPIIRRHVDEMLVVAEEEIADAIVRLLEESKLVAEGAGRRLDVGPVQDGVLRDVAQ